MIKNSRHQTIEALDRNNSRRWRPRVQTTILFFAAVRAGTLAHLRRHGCGCYPFFDGSLLGSIAGAARAQRILELGTALGYTACWFAHGAPEARIDRSILTRNTCGSRAATSRPQGSRTALCCTRARSTRFCRRSSRATTSVSLMDLIRRCAISRTCVRCCARAGSLLPLI